VGVDAVGVDECEFAEGGFPALELGAFDELARGFALVLGCAGFLGALPGSFVLDVHDRQPEELDDGGVVGEVAAVLDDLAQLVVQRLDGLS
jgi:hypothetical protein